MLTNGLGPFSNWHMWWREGEGGREGAIQSTCKENESFSGMVIVLCSLVARQTDLSFACNCSTVKADKGPPRFLAVRVHYIVLFGFARKSTKGHVRQCNSLRPVPPITMASSSKTFIGSTTFSLCRYLLDVAHLGCLEPSASEVLVALRCELGQLPRQRESGQTCSLSRKLNCFLWRGCLWMGHHILKG